MEQWDSIQEFKRQGWRQSYSMGPKSTQETGPKTELGTSYSIYMRGLSRRQATYSLSQSRRQGQRQGCRRVRLQQSSGKEQRPRPELKWRCWAIDRVGAWRSHVRVVCAVKGWWCPQGPDTSRSLVGQIKSCLLCTLSCLTSFNDITGTYNRVPLFHWRERKVCHMLILALEILVIP